MASASVNSFPDRLEQVKETVIYTGSRWPCWYNEASHSPWTPRQEGS